MKRALTATALAALVLAAFWPSLGNDFVNFDDPRYVTENPWVRQGLSLEGLGWAWTSDYASNWHPLTWISHMLDWQLFGANPRGHHLTSVLLHLANTILLFVLLEWMTGQRARSAFAAALFAVHPLHVESVAWIAERKDVLSTLFWMLATLAYVGAVKHGTRSARIALIVAFGLGLAAKPMLVSLPLTLLLLDSWPLRRWSPDPAAIRRLLVEKAPLLVLATASAIVTFLVQHAGDAVRTFDRYPPTVRLTNALVSYVHYLAKTVLPFDLAVFYPHPGASPAAWTVAGSALLLIGVSVAALRLRRTRPYVCVGWAWYLITLVPVIGLVQVGSQAMADRYTYVPLIGIFFIVAWGGRDLLRAVPRRVVGVAALVLLVLLTLQTRRQTRTWRDSETLFRHALAVTRNNPVAHLNLGAFLADRGLHEEASGHYLEVLRIQPGHLKAHVNLANAMRNLGRIDEAFEQYARALEIDDGSAAVHYNLGLALASEGRLDEALEHYRSARAIDPADPLIRNNMGNALSRLGRPDQAIAEYRAALSLRPDHARAHANLAGALFLTGRYAEAWSEIHASRRLGFEPPSQLVRDLAAKMADPGID